MKKALLLLALCLISCGSPAVSSSPTSEPSSQPASESASESSSTERSSGVPIENARLDVDRLNIAVGETIDLVVVTSPEGADKSTLVWTSSDSGVASVSASGVVTALKEGEVEIRVTDSQNEMVTSSCAIRVFPAAKKEIADAEVVFTPKDIEVIHYRRDNKQSANVFYRQDRLKSVPYMKIEDYYKFLLGKTLNVSADSSSFTITAASGGIATIDAEKDILTSDDNELFVDTTIYRQDGVYNTYYDGAPFVRVKESKMSKAPKKTVINFAQYGINLIAQGGSLYLPVATLSNIFMGPTMLTCLYDSTHLYFIDPNYPDMTTSSVTADPDYVEDLHRRLTSGDRTPEEGAFSYGELRFLIDTYYGASGRETLHDEFIKNRNLDEALSQKDRTTKICRNLLQSVDQIDYCAGVLILDDYLSDAGHTVIYSGLYRVLNRDDELSGIVRDRIFNVGYTIGEQSAPRRADAKYSTDLTMAQIQSGTKNNSYLRKDDTLFYRFDAFNFDLHEWSAFYQKRQEMPQDCVGNLHRMLEEYKNDNTVKNVVLDISTNGGGYADIVFTMLAMTTGKAYLHYRDVIADNVITTEYDIDLNFDGVFDEKDKSISYPFHFAVLTSARSFSCGNLLPCLAREQGVLIMGDNSGGGCCAVLDACSAEGMYVRISSQVHMLTLEGNEVEGGADVGVSLVSRNEQGEYDFSKFYDFSLLSREMNAYYEKNSK